MSAPQFAFFLWLLAMILLGTRNMKDGFGYVLLAVLVVFGPLVAILWWGGFFQ